MSIFCQKNVQSPKTKCSDVIFLSFHEKPNAFKHIIFVDLVRKRHFCQTNVYILGHKSQQNALFFQFFAKKSVPLCPYFIKKGPFSKKYNALIPLFCQKTLIFKNTGTSCHFFQNYHEKPAAVMPIFGQKTSILSKLYYGP